MIPPCERLGASYLGRGRTAFRVWAPFAPAVAVHWVSPHGEQTVRLDPSVHGYYEGIVDGVHPGDRYRFRLGEDAEFPDPASRWQPDGVHGPSAVTDPRRLVWHDQQWHGRPWQELIFYELHVGTYSPSGTFEGIIPDLPRLAALGVTALEIMPIAEFPGARNWGYDGVFPFAAQSSYGGPQGLARLIDACHQYRIAVILDVVYNHMGPEGNILPQFGPYFSNHYRTPWGSAINFDGPDSDAVRQFFWQSAYGWIMDYHIDGFRLDAVHAIIDTSAHPFLTEFTQNVDALSAQCGRALYTVAESNRNDPREIVPRDQEGIGFSGQWNDDLHHALHALVTGERTGYYQDFGSADDLAKSLSEGYVFTGQYSPYRRRRHGRPFDPNRLGQLLVFGQNHDQVGNRPMGDRLTTRLSPAELRLAAATALLSPGTPLLFMGEEYGETAPFPYFIDHSDPELIQAVRRGRSEQWEPGEEIPPDPAAPDTFFSAKLAPARQNELSAWYQALLGLRREYLAPCPLQAGVRPMATVFWPHSLIHLWYRFPHRQLIVLLNFDSLSLPFSFPKNAAVLLDADTPTRRGSPHAPLPTPPRISPKSCLVAHFE